MTENSFTQQDLEMIARGACLLASGGGGTLDSAMNLVKNFKKSDYYDGTNPVFKIISKEEAVEKKGYGVAVAYLGAPEALKNAKYPKAVVNAVNQIKYELEKDNDTSDPQEKKFLKYIVPAEVGALSSVVPCLAASKLNLEVIDGDGAGRAVPELPMLTYAVEEIPVNPTVLANDTGYYIKLDIGGFEGKGGRSHESAAEAVENLARPIVGLKEFNQIAGLAIWVMGPDEIDRGMQITGTLTKSLKTGREIQEKNADQIIDFLNKGCEKGKETSFKIFEGIFSAEGCKTATAGGFDKGTIRIINAMEEDFTGIFQNETLLAWNSSESSPIAMAPDSIAYYVDNEQKVYSNGDILGEDGTLAGDLKDKKVTVIGISARKELRENEENKINSSFFKENEKEGIIMKSFKKALLELGYAGRYIKIENIWRKKF